MKKYIFWLGMFVILPIIAQLILADNISLKWVACRRYLIIASLTSYILSKVELSKKIMVNFFAMYFIMGTSVAFVYKYIKHSQVNGEFLWDEFTVAIGITSVFYAIMLLARHININTPKLFAGVQFILLLPYLLNLGYAFIEKDSFTADSLIAIYQTNINEIGEFFKSTAPIHVYITIIFVILLIIIFLNYTLRWGG